MKELHFTDTWHLPFMKDPEGYCSYIWDSDSNMVFTFVNGKNYKNDLMLYNRIVDVLNGDSTEYFPEGCIGYNDDCIYTREKTDSKLSETLLVRGWGYLTSEGGLNLEPEMALKLQKELVDYCYMRLRGVVEPIKTDKHNI